MARNIDDIRPQTGLSGTRDDNSAKLAIKTLPAIVSNAPSTGDVRRLEGFRSIRSQWSSAGGHPVESECRDSLAPGSLNLQTDDQRLLWPRMRQVEACPPRVLVKKNASRTLVTSVSFFGRRRSELRIPRGIPSLLSLDNALSSLQAMDRSLENSRYDNAEAFGEAGGSVVSVPLSFGLIVSKSSFSASVWHWIAPF